MEGIEYREIFTKQLESLKRQTGERRQPRDEKNRKLGPFPGLGEPREQVGSPEPLGENWDHSGWCVLGAGKGQQLLFGRS